MSYRADGRAVVLTAGTGSLARQGSLQLETVVPAHLPAGMSYFVLRM